MELFYVQVFLRSGLSTFSLSTLGLSTFSLLHSSFSTSGVLHSVFLPLVALPSVAPSYNIPSNLMPNPSLAGTRKQNGFGLLKGRFLKHEQ